MQGRGFRAEPSPALLCGSSTRPYPLRASECSERLDVAGHFLGRAPVFVLFPLLSAHLEKIADHDRVARGGGPVEGGLLFLVFGLDVGACVLVLLEHHLDGGEIADGAGCVQDAVAELVPRIQVRAQCYQLGDHLDVAAGDGEVEARVAHLGRCVDLGAVLAQDLDHCDVALLDRKVDRLLGELVFRVGVSALGFSLEERGEDLTVAARARPVQRRLLVVVW
mmetsp:Transcript_31302/g.74959  ORF Transcript_31302/g.74959 Transcript_31302/m.74959 type:complete len:222 (+) Transcript_31302:786-1451(+)